MSATPQVGHDEHHRALVRQLSSELTRCRPLWPVSVRLGLWVGLDVGVIAWVVINTTNHFVAKLNQPYYLIEVVFFMVAATVSAALALRSAIPGRAAATSAAVIAITLVLIATIAVTIAQPIDTNYQLGDFARTGLRCARVTLMLGALPWLALWWLVRRGAPLNGRLSGLFVGSGALLFSFAVMRIACPIDEPLHLLTWHLLPSLLVIALSAIAGSFWLRFWPRVLHATGND
jgi:hypothetical protein